MSWSPPHEACCSDLGEVLVRGVRGIFPIRGIPYMQGEDFGEVAVRGGSSSTSEELEGVRFRRNSLMMSFCPIFVWACDIMDTQCVA